MRKFDPWSVFFRREWSRNWPFLVGFSVAGAIITKMSLGFTEEEAKNSQFAQRNKKKKLDPRNPQQSNSSKSSSSSPDDPFIVFESCTSEANASSWPFSELSEHHHGISSVTSSIDELEDFANFKVRSDTTERPHVPKKDFPVKKPVDRAQEKSKNVRVTINKPSMMTKPKSTAEGHMSAVFGEKGRPEEKKSSFSKKNVSPVKNFVDDLMFFWRLCSFL